MQGLSDHPLFHERLVPPVRPTDFGGGVPCAWVVFFLFGPGVETHLPPGRADGVVRGVVVGSAPRTVFGFLLVMRETPLPLHEEKGGLLSCCGAGGADGLFFFGRPVVFVLGCLMLRLRVCFTGSVVPPEDRLVHQ